MPAGCHQPSVVSSYLAFSPLPPKRRLFSVTAARDLSRLGFPQQGALPCPDFPHPGTEAPERGGSPHLICGAKIIKKIDYAWLAATVASRSRASARMTIGFRTVYPVDISICHLHVSHSQHTKSGAKDFICSKSLLPISWEYL